VTRIDEQRYDVSTDDPRGAGEEDAHQWPTLSTNGILPREEKWTADRKTLAAPPNSLVR
jgi:hypothetical protein